MASMGDGEHRAREHPLVRHERTDRRVVRDRPEVHGLRGRYQDSNGLAGETLERVADPTATSPSKNLLAAVAQEVASERYVAFAVR